MKPRIHLLLFAAFFGASFVLAGGTPLDKQMEKMDEAYKAFRKTEDAAVGAAKAREAQVLVLQGLSEVPAMLANMPEGSAKAKAAASYRQMMGQLYVKFCEAEQAFLDNKLDRVEALVSEIKELKKRGHTEFKKDD